MKKIFQPKYSISPLLLKNIKRIAVLTDSTNSLKVPDIIQMDQEIVSGQEFVFSEMNKDIDIYSKEEIKEISHRKIDINNLNEIAVVNYGNGFTWINNQIVGLSNKKKKFVFSSKVVIETHRLISQGLLSGNQIGFYRREPMLVNDLKTGKPVYLPPDKQDVAVLMEQLVLYVQENIGKIDPLILAGVFHKQMVLISPFTKGNETTSRLLSKLLLAEIGLRESALFNFSNFALRNKETYVSRVGEKGDWYEINEELDFTDWLEYFTEDIIAEMTHINKVYKESSVKPEQILLKHEKRMLEHIAKFGLINDGSYAKIVKRAKATRALDYKKLIGSGHIKRLGQGKSTYYILEK